LTGKLFSREVLVKKHNAQQQRMLSITRRLQKPKSNINKYRWLMSLVTAHNAEMLISKLSLLLLLVLLLANIYLAH